MLVMAQNKKAMFDTAHARLFVQRSVNNEESGDKPWVVVSFADGRNRDPHPIIVSSHDTEEEAMMALAYIYAMAVAEQPAVSMPKYTNNMDDEAAAAIMANTLAKDCF